MIFEGMKGIDAIVRQYLQHNTVNEVSGGVMGGSWSHEYSRMYLRQYWGSEYSSLGKEQKKNGSQILLLISTTGNTRGYEVTEARVRKTFKDLETFKACAVL